MSQLRPPRVIKPKGVKSARAPAAQPPVLQPNAGQEDAPDAMDAPPEKGTRRPIQLPLWLSIIAVAVAAIALWGMDDAQMTPAGEASPQSFVYRITRAEWPQEPTLGAIFDRYPMDSQLKLATRALNGGNGQCMRLDERMPYGTEIIIATSSEGAERCTAAVR